MNLAQRIVLILGVLAVIGIALFPPWVFVYSYPGCCNGVINAERSERPAGYHLIFGQHVPQDQTYLVTLFDIDTRAPLRSAKVMPERTRLQFFSLRIDIARLAVQITAAVLLMAILFLAVRSSPRATAH